MDDEDVYGIPSDYYHYSEAMPQHYSENVPTSSFDELLDETFADESFEDSGEYMRVICVSLILSRANLYSVIGPYNPAPFGGPSEPEIEHLNAGPHGHRGLGSVPSGLLPRPFPPELGQPTHDQSLQCMCSIVRKFIPTELFL